jgi:BTB/POZ domain-containing protein KCTD9
MTNNPPTIDELRNSFNRVYHGPDRLQREYELAMEAERLGVPLDTYRRLYELRGEEHIDPYPKPKKWWCAPSDWGKWVWHLPPKKKLALSRKGVVKLVQSGVIVTVALALSRYVWEAPKREKLAHYQAWQMINSAAGQKTSGGRINALQDLNKDGVSLQGLDANGANLERIKLQNANLSYANLSYAILWGTNLSYADLGNTKLSNANLSYANLSYANLNDADLGHAILGAANLINTKFLNANLTNANLWGTNLSNADLGNTNLNSADLWSTNLTNADLQRTNLTNAIIDCSDKFCTNFKGTKNITPEQIKKAHNWESACYDPEFRKKLGLPPQNPKCAGE